MKYILFKSGDYGTKGNWQGDVFNRLIDNTNEIPIIPYHTSEFTERGMLKNEIPIIGKFKNISIEGDTIISSDIEIFNKIDFKHRNVDRLSIEIEDGKIKRVGALPVGVPPAAPTTSLKGLEFQETIKMEWIKQDSIINFRKEDKMDLNAILEALKGMSIEDKIKIINTIISLFSEEELGQAKEKLDLSKFQEKKEDKPVQKTEDQIKEEAKAEFRKETQVKEFMQKNENKITPAMKLLGVEKMVEKLILSTDTIEFSENGKNKELDSVEALTGIFENLPEYKKSEYEFSGGLSTTDVDKEVEEYKKRWNK